MSINHSFVSAIVDGGDTSLVRPTDWNAEHVTDFTMPGVTVGPQPDKYSVMTSNLAYYSRIFVPFTFTPNRICIAVNVSSGNVDLGLYTDSGTGQAPASRIVSLGSTSLPGTGTRKFTISPGAIGPGVYWVAVAVNNGTASFGYQGFGSGSGGGGPHATSTQTTAFPLPSSAAVTTADFTWAPAAWLESV